MARNVRDTQPPEDSGDQDMEMPEPGDTVVDITTTPQGILVQENNDGTVSIVHPNMRKKQRPAGAAQDFGENLAEDPNIDCERISANLKELIEADRQARQDWEDMAARGIKLIGVKLEEAKSEVSETGTVASFNSSLLLEAVMQSWCNSQAELLPAEGPVKIEDISDDSETAERVALAQDAQTDYNYYLTTTDKEYYPDFRQMLMARALIGTAYRKVYRCPIRRRPVSVWVKATDLIVSPEASHLSGAARVTERFTMRPGMVKRMIACGQWLDVPLGVPFMAPTSVQAAEAEVAGIRQDMSLSRPDDQNRQFYECYCELDDDGLNCDETGNDPGYPLPYRVTMEAETGKVLEIRRCWKEGDEDHKARRRYVKYGFIPNFSGPYDLGFVHLIGNQQRVSTAIEQISVDTGMFASFPGGMIAKGPGSRMNNSIIRPNVGEWIPVETGGLPLSQVVMPMPYKDASPQLIGLDQSIKQDARRLAGIIETPVGDGGTGDAPVATMMTYVEQVTKVPAAVHKGDHQSQREEFDLLRELFLEEPEALTKFARKPSRAQWALAELSDLDLLPTSDPNVPSQTHRIMTAAALTQAGSMPFFQGIANPRGIWNKMLATMGIKENGEETLPPAPPQQQGPDPKTMAVAAKVQSDNSKTAAQVQVAQIKAQSELQNSAVQAQARQAASESAERVAALKQQTEDAKATNDLIKHGSSLAVDHVQHMNEMNQAATENAHDNINQALDRQQSAQLPMGGGIVSGEDQTQ